MKTQTSLFPVLNSLLYSCYCYVLLSSSHNFNFKYRYLRGALNELFDYCLIRIFWVCFIKLLKLLKIKQVISKNMSCFAKFEYLSGVIASI